MKLNWYSRKGILFFPTSIIGWLILCTAISGAVYIFIDIDSRSHSVSDTLINVFFNYMIIGAVYSMIGFLTAKKN